MLLEHRADIDQTDGSEATPLFIAAQANSVDCVQLLVEHKADINRARKDGTTPAYVAALKNSVEVLQLLLSAKADILASGTTKSSRNSSDNRGRVSE